MFQQPDCEQLAGFTRIPVQKTIWKYFCHAGEEKGILSLIANICPNAKVTDLNEEFFGGDLIYGGLDRAPGIVGTFKEGDDTLIVEESAAWLIDRLKKPVPFTDKVSQYRTGPVSLKYTHIGNGVTQFYWSNE